MRGWIYSVIVAVALAASAAIVARAGSSFPSGASGGSNLTGDPDVIPSAPDAFDDEFNANSLDASWTQITATSASETGLGALQLSDTSSNRLTGVIKTISGSTWTVTAKVQLLAAVTPSANPSYTGAGIVLKEAATGKYQLHEIGFYSGGASGSAGEVRTLTTQRTGLDWNNNVEITGGSHVRPWSGLGNVAWTPPAIYLRVQRTASNLVYSTSLDGRSWSTNANVSTTTYFTTAPDTVGVGVNSFGGAVLADFDWIRKS